MSKCVTPLQRHLWPQSVNSIEELCIKRLSNRNVILSKEIQGVQSILSINYCISISLLMNTVWSVNDGTAETRLKPAGNLPWWVSGEMEALYKANCPSSCHAGVHCTAAPSLTDHMPCTVWLVNDVMETRPCWFPAKYTNLNAFPAYIKSFFLINSSTSLTNTR